jgi:hypothetical protein
MDAIQPAGRLERAVNPERIDDPTLYALPGVDPALALVRHRDDGAADAFDLLYPQETQPTTAVCPFLTPPDPRESESGGALPTVSPPSPASKPPSEILNGYEFVCGGAA